MRGGETRSRTRKKVSKIVRPCARTCARTCARAWSDALKGASRSGEFARREGRGASTGFRGGDGQNRQQRERVVSSPERKGSKDIVAAPLNRSTRAIDPVRTRSYLRACVTGSSFLHPDYRLVDDTLAKSILLRPSACFFFFIFYALNNE